MQLAGDRIGLPTGGAVVSSARLVAAVPEVRSAPTPINPSGITMARPEYCEVKGEIHSVDPAAPPIRFQVNLPTEWNGEALHQGGGGYDGNVVTALGALPRAPDTTPYPITLGYVTFGSDGGHEGNDASFAVNQEALVNFAYGHVPGGDHGGANAPSKVDLFGMLATWVDRGRAPAENIEAAEYGPDRRVKRAKPLCAYPTYPQYTGKGDPNIAASYRCVPVAAR
jgi:hypothetical protein